MATPPFYLKKDNRQNTVNYFENYIGYTILLYTSLACRMDNNGNFLFSVRLLDK